MYMGVLCCFALFVCLTLLASFFLPSHLSFKNMYIEVKITASFVNILSNGQATELYIIGVEIHIAIALPEADICISMVSKKHALLRKISDILILDRIILNFTSWWFDTCRNTFTYLASILVVVCFWVLLEKVNSTGTNNITPHDGDIFWVCGS